MTIDNCEFVVIVVARMSSRRLPGKSMMRLTDRTVLGHVVSRVTRSREADCFLVATSSDPSDDPIAEWCAQSDVRCFRGSLLNVALRVFQASMEVGARNIVRISADSPFIDPVLIDHAIELFRRNTVNLVTNVSPRAFPVGQSVEVFTVEVLERILFEGLTREQEEHVTKGFYDLSNEFRILNFYPNDVTDTATGDHSAVHMSIDSAEDLVTATGVAELMGTHLNAASWLDIEKAWLEIAGARES
jgi:spore coat polysaccharide biosynthesis protein SpsF